MRKHVPKFATVNDCQTSDVFEELSFAECFTVVSVCLIRIPEVCGHCASCYFQSLKPAFLKCWRRVRIMFFECDYDAL